ncbi:MAG: hypothetical protein J6S40_03605, partial [Thermoguttaceae bacterium]|nr:hypothetical protein [Thermoguttaceae bacterium]
MQDASPSLPPKIDSSPETRPGVPPQVPPKQSGPAGDRLQEFRRACAEIETELQKTVVGQKSVIRLLLASIFTRGHSLLEGVPGLVFFNLMNARDMLYGKKGRRAAIPANI